MVFLQICGFPVHAQEKLKVQETQEIREPDNLYAQSAVLMDADSGRILYGKEQDIKRPMASTTKIMTCILALERMEEGQTAEVSGYASAQPEVHLGVQAGEQYYLKDLLYSLMLESHNDSAVVVAEGIGGSVENFAAIMNEKAQELGCGNTHFVTPNGLDGEDEGGIHATTAADLARIMKYCIMDSPKREQFLEVTRTKDYQFSDVAGTRTFSCRNHNAFLDMMDGALSGKTGFTGDAGYCYVGALARDGKTFIVALLACGWPNNKNYKWKDTCALMEYGLSNYEYRDVEAGVPVRDIAVENGVSRQNIYERKGLAATGLSEETAGELQVLLRADEEVEVREERKEKLSAPIEEGELVGRAVYILDGVVLANYDIVTLEAVAKRDAFWCFRQLLCQFCC